MTSLTIETNPDVDRLLVAGRKAALGALYDRERNKTIPGTIDRHPDDYDGKGDILVRTAGADAADIGPAIDAAVLEVMVQIGPRSTPSVARPRPWWKVWGR